MKAALILSAIAGANAFAPASQQARSTQLNVADISELRGVGPETGGKVYDPFNVAEMAPLDHLRKAELANGRSAMLATVGWYFPKIWTFPDGPITTTDPIKAHLEADNQWWAQFIVFCAVIEGIKLRGEMEGKSYTGEIGKEAALDWTGQWAKMNDAQKETMALKELKNGRLAMMGWAGFVANYFIPGACPVPAETMKLAIAALLVASASAFAPAPASKASTSLKVSEVELGVTEPLGVYDPLGWLESEPEAFERRRAVERKHGRVAMAAVVGTVVHNNHIVFDGYLSPSNNLKFSDVPTGIDGIFTVPTAGLAQILAFFALVELAWMPASKYDGDYGVGYFGTDVKDPEEKARKLNAELNNGRAAMMGIIGNMVAEKLTGQTMFEQYSSGHISPFGDGQGVF